MRRYPSSWGFVILDRVGLARFLSGAGGGEGENRELGGRYILHFWSGQLDSL